HGDVACDHYHRYKEDVALMRQLGVRSYRFSISWSRVLPEGRGAVNEKGLDFYKRLLDELLAARLVPMCTLFHWDFPQALFERGGWQNRDSADWFGDYAALIADRLSDRIEFFATQNEPQVYCGKGHLDGEHAPGLRLPFRDYLTVAHNSMRAHGRAVQALRASARRPLKIGYVPAIQGTQPAQETAQDIEAARHGFLRVADRNSWNNSWWLDPVILGRYPEDGLAAYAADLPRFPPRDLDDMKQPIDFLGLNIYWAAQWRAGASGPEQVHYIPGYPRSAVNWQPLTPAVMYWAPRFSWERWQLPMYITENGLATRDQIFLDGKVHDPQRIDVLHRYLSQLARATGEGIPVRGYYHWSLLDNFEWAEGYVQRFGIVYVDYGTQRRIPKDSYHWYRKVVASNGRTLSGRTAVPPLRMTDGG
ncbi:MAG: family 1 glycosylhydrolase, partial [Armatimonadota bacterium]|nr:family 1 glycosylhydrolase [Armatimonadota bacterium]